MLAAYSAPWGEGTGGTPDFYAGYESRRVALRGRAPADGRRQALQEGRERLRGFPWATERRIDEFRRRPTLPFNGYAEQVAELYARMDLRRFF